MVKFSLFIGWMIFLSISPYCSKHLSFKVRILVETAASHSVNSLKGCISSVSICLLISSIHLSPKMSIAEVIGQSYLNSWLTTNKVEIHTSNTFFKNITSQTEVIYYFYFKNKSNKYLARFIMSEIQISTLGLALSIIPVTLHGIEVLFPLQSRMIVNWVLPFFGLKSPISKIALTKDEQLTMLDAALSASPKEKNNNAKDYIFLLLFEQRQGAIGFIAIAVGAIYGMGIELVLRQPLHLLFGVVAVLMMLANANQARFLPFFGKHPRVSKHGRNVGIVFTPFWLVVALLNLSAFYNVVS